MGTRGFITFVTEDEEKTAYNHWDSYPDGLGLKVLDFLFDVDSLDLMTKVTALRLVTDDEGPTKEDINRLRKYADLQVSRQTYDEWYALLRNTQGDIKLMLEAGVIEDAKYFPCDSLFAEWGYVIDLDGMVFEVYKGFQNDPGNQRGRFAGRRVPGMTDGYLPCTRVASWPLSELPSRERFMQQLNQISDE